jgi:hypothetical protein
MKQARAGLSASFFILIMLLTPEASPGATPGSIISPLPVDPEFKPRSGTYYYTVGYNDMNIGTASIAIENEKDFYKVQVNARTIGMVDHIYHLRYRGEAVMDTDPLSSLILKVQQDVRSNEKVTSVHFQPDGAINTVETKSKDGDPVDHTIRNVQTDKFTLDPFSATYLVRGLDWEVGTEKVFDVYPGKHQYELRLKCIGKESLIFAGEKRDAWVIVPKAINLDPEKRADAAKKKPADIKIYVSADGLRDVLKVEAHHTLGQFLARLDRFEPAAQTREDSIKKIPIREEVIN